MNYSPTRAVNGNVMPLLMGCTMPGRIMEAAGEEPAMYDPISQISYNMRTVGTKSLKTVQTRKPCSAIGCGYVNHPDKKNEIDDQKNVK